MKFYIPLALLTLGFGTAWSDTITLKSGEKVDGKITQVTPDEVTIEVAFSASIREERVIPRSEIATMDQVQADAKAFADLKKIPFPETALNGKPYDDIIQGKLNVFLKNYGYSEKVNEVRDFITRLEAEKSRVEEGAEVKYRGAWISRSDYEERRYEIDSELAYLEMGEAAARGNLSAVLNQFGRFEETWPNSVYYPDAVEAAKDAARKLVRTIAFHLDSAANQEKRKIRSLELAPTEQKAALEAAMKQDEARYEALLAQAKSGKDKFIPLYPQYIPALNTLQEAAKAEIVRLDAIELTPLKTSVRLARQAERELQRGELPVAEKTLDQALAAWPTNHLATNLKAKLETEREAITQAAEASAKAARDAAELQEQKDKAEGPGKEGQAQN